MAKNPLWKRFETEKAAYARLKRQAEKKVVRWEHWTGLHWHWDPSELKMEQWENRTHWKKNPPKQTNPGEAYYSYGYDSAGRVVVIRCLTEHFIRYSRDGFEVSEYYEGKLHNVGSGLFVGEKTVSVTKAGMSGEKDWMRVQWDGDQIVRIVFGEYGEKASLEWVFTNTGKLVGMHDLPRKLPKGTNLKTLSKAIRHHLLKTVPMVVAKSRIKEPAYCLILAYDGEGNGVMPPEVIVGLDSERKKIIEKHGRKAKRFLWSPDEFEHPLSKPRDLPNDKKFEKACELYNRIHYCPVKFSSTARLTR